MIFFKDRGHDDPIYDLISPAGDMSRAIGAIVEMAERYSLKGNAVRTYFALRLFTDENILGRICELSSEPLGSIEGIAAHELWRLRSAFVDSTRLLRAEQAPAIAAIFSYIPSSRGEKVPDHLIDQISELGDMIVEANDPLEALEPLVELYRSRGSGLFGLHRGYRCDEGGELVPFVDAGQVPLDALIGYDAQKRALLEATERFVSGSGSNVLLHGDSGTGKSTSVRALLAERSFVDRGLRIIEMPKGSFAQIPHIVDKIRGRNYRFIIFMDDLSFEEHEVEYRYLKALIEGGLEGRPRNAVVYATSNRRNIVREVWADRKMKSDDVHGGDTMQEKLSLADRFGVSIWYGPATKDEYLAMVRAAVSKRGISMPDDELERAAMSWEVGKGAFTGRTASQFAEYLPN